MTILTRERWGRPWKKEMFGKKGSSTLHLPSCHWCMFLYRSSCANDRCLFITNIHSMPTPGAENDIVFNSGSIANVSQFDSVYNQTHQSFKIPNKSSFAHRSYHKAVDQDTETCWDTQRGKMHRQHRACQLWWTDTRVSIIAPLAGDYFGLYMVGDIHAKRIILYTPTKLDQALDQVFQVTVQFVPFGSWEECDIQLTPLNQLDYRIGFDVECPRKDSFKSIRITFKQDMQHAFELCSFGLDNFVV